MTARDPFQAQKSSGRLARKLSRAISALTGRRAALVELARDGRRSFTPWDKRELHRLASLTRFEEGQARFFGQSIHYTDAASFISAFTSIFLDKAYDFESDTRDPVIIDGGANIGLATLYWSARFRSPRIFAFEPDGRAFDALTTNIKSFALAGVDLRQEALWTTEGHAAFRPDYADGGRLESQGDHIVRTALLSEVLEQRVDLLKLDIEGAEVDVLASAESNLPNVLKMFVEYHGFADQPRRLDVLLKLLTRNGFRYWIQTEYQPDNPLVRATVDAGMDLRLNIRATRGGNVS